MPPRRDNLRFPRIVKKGEFLFSAGKRITVWISRIRVAGWTMVVRMYSVGTGSFALWCRVHGRSLCRRWLALPGAARRFFFALAGRAARHLPKGWIRVGGGLVLVLQTLRPFVGRAACRSTHAGRVALAWLWPRLEGAMAVVDWFLTQIAEKVDEWGGPVGAAARRAVLRAGVPLLTGCRSAGYRLSGWAGRFGRALGGRYGRSRFATWPPAYQMLSVVLALVMVLVPYQLGWAKNTLLVTAGGRMVGAVAGPDEVWVALRQLEDENARLYGLQVAPLDKIDCVWVHSSSPLLAQDELLARLARDVRFGVWGAGISVNGQVKMVLADQATAEKTLRDFAARYQAGGTSVHFKETVAIVPVAVPVQKVVSEQEALALLGASQTKPATYTVKEGDTLWQLARTFHIGIDTLTADNPGMDINHLGIGEVINLGPVSQLVNVLATYQTTIDEPIPYQIQWKKDPNLGYGQQELVQAGCPGEEEVVAVVTEENGIEISRQVLQSQVVKAPVPEIEDTGGNIEIASRGGDYHGVRFIWPAAGPITSPFGFRTIFGRREFHSGIDIGAGYGTPVVAAASGVVTFTGWESGYGRVVMVSHGGGLSTLYAHLSSILVRQGESVGQGQEVGRVGETGDATGPHVHFEVREDGTPVNPMNFL